MTKCDYLMEEMRLLKELAKAHRQIAEATEMQRMILDAIVNLKAEEHGIKFPEEIKEQAQNEP